MIVLKENQRFYPKTWSYNAARILSELAVIVENNGGRVKPTKTAVISDRCVDDFKMEYMEKINHLKELEKESHNEKRTNAIINYSKKLDELEKINNDPVRVTHTTYIDFVIDNIYYYYQLPNNPFFEILYLKTPIKDGKYSKNIYLTEINKDWLYDCFLKCGCSESDIKEAAYIIFNQLITTKESEIYRDCKRVRVPNTYSNGYHYEKIYEPERFQNVDF